jgi:hypothetical protein
MFFKVFFYFKENQDYGSTNWHWANIIKVATMLSKMTFDEMTRSIMAFFIIKLSITTFNTAVKYVLLGSTIILWVIKPVHFAELYWVPLY